GRLRPQPRRPDRRRGACPVAPPGPELAARRPGVAGAAGGGGVGPKPAYGRTDPGAPGALPPPRRGPRPRGRPEGPAGARGDGRALAAGRRPGRRRRRGAGRVARRGARGLAGVLGRGRRSGRTGPVEERRFAEVTAPGTPFANEFPPGTAGGPAMAEADVEGA